ncbi:MAG: TolC family protein, partial [Muribaculaceae bacterium]|nr:TolC family protein [Muribaculaceae bacterium]
MSPNFAAMKRTPTILISLLLALPMQAQMTLNDCLVYAREHAHSNRINRLEVEVASTDKRIGVADMLPYIGLGANGSLSFGRNIDPETNTYDNKKTLGTGFGIDLSLPLFDGLVRLNNVKALKTAELRKKKSSLVEEDRVSLEVIKDFYNVSYCQAMVDQMNRQLRRDSTDLLATERGEELGTKSGADVAELKAIVAADIYELANQRNLLKKAYLTLRSVMGMPLIDEPLQLVDSTPTLVDSPHLLDVQYPASEIPFSRNLPDI